MNITKHGVNSREELMPETFKCEHCGCEFSANYDEYYVRRGSQITSATSTTYIYRSTVVDVYVCSCPECHKIITKETQRVVEDPTITLTCEGKHEYKNCEQDLH